MGGGGGGLLGGIQTALFGDGGAEAAGNAAIAQQIQAGKNYRDVLGRVNTAQDQFAASGRQLEGATVAGLASLDRDIANQEKNLARQEQLVSQIDPTIIEASQQALRLLRGEQSTALKPIQEQRQTQRQKVVNMLREQLGPGAETSTAGIQALTRFDAETNQLMAGAQQGALGQLGGLANQFTASRPDMFREIMGRSALGQQQYGLRANQAQFGQQQAAFGMQGAELLNNAANSMYQSAGAGYVAPSIRGQAQASFGNALVGAAAGGIGAGLGKKWFGGD